MIFALELLANMLNTAGIFLAGRNSRHTWWVGILACVLFTGLFAQRHFYENAAQQIFFIATNLVGWWNWSARRGDGRSLPIRRSSPPFLLALGLASALATWIYELTLQHFVPGARPLSNSLVLGFSIMAQFLLMGRRWETWPCWLLVNGICVPLFVRDGMMITALLCAVYFINSVFAALKWRRIMGAEVTALPPTL